MNVEPYTKEEHDAEMEAIRSVGDDKQAEKNYSMGKKWSTIANTVINDLHITKEDVKTEEDVDFYTKVVLKHIVDSHPIARPGEYDYMKDEIRAALDKLYRESRDPIAEKMAAQKGNKFAKPHEPADVDKTKNRIDKSKFDIKRFMGNVYDETTGM